MVTHCCGTGTNGLFIRDYIERYFPSPFTAVYRREFWGGLDLDPQSPQMLEVSLKLDLDTMKL
jgi:hypothetical protein